MNVTNTIETEYSLSVGIEHRKKYAQFFTPADIAEVMADWLIGNTDLSDVLEPAFGLGIFSRALLARNPDLKITGFDIDGVILDNASKLFESNENVNLICQDYIFSDWTEKYDGIICNPPYFKFHDYDNQKIIRAVNEELGGGLKFQTNLYALFLLKSLAQLRPNGRCAYIVPAEFLNSDYGVVIKDSLLRSGKLRHVIVFDFKENVFNDALTTSAIILCADDGHDEVSFSYINDYSEFDKISKTVSAYPQRTVADRTYAANALDPGIKWKNYYSPRELPEFDNLVSFGTYAKVMRGIATGANDYFSFNKSKLRAFGISIKDVCPCVCHSADIAGCCFTVDDFNALRDEDKKVYILNPRSRHNKELRMYINKGIDEEIDKRYLTSKRNPWYSMEKRSPSPIWVNVFNRSGLRFVRNETQTLTLTTFHCVYVNDNLFGVDADLLFAYLISNISKTFFSVSGREYGNGLNKYEPNDLNNSYMLDIGNLSDTCKEELKMLYRANKSSGDLSYIKEIDRILIDNFS